MTNKNYYYYSSPGITKVCHLQRTTKYVLTANTPRMTSPLPTFQYCATGGLVVSRLSPREKNWNVSKTKNNLLNLISKGGSIVKFKFQNTVLQYSVLIRNYLASQSSNAVFRGMFTFLSQNCGEKRELAKVWLPEMSGTSLRKLAWEGQIFESCDMLRAYLVFSMLK